MSRSEFGHKPSRVMSPEDVQRMLPAYQALLAELPAVQQEGQVAAEESVFVPYLNKLQDFMVESLELQGTGHSPLESKITATYALLVLRDGGDLGKANFGFTDLEPERMEDPMFQLANAAFAPFRDQAAA